MKRREMLFGGAASLGAATQARATQPELRFDGAAVEATLGRIDRRMASFGIPTAPDGDEDAGTRLTRAALRTLYFTGAFMDLEEHERMHPGVQARMFRLQPEMDEAVRGMTTLLGSMTTADHKRLQQNLQSDPGIGTRVAELFEQVTHDDRFGWVRRKDVRLAVADYARRMQAQNPALVIDPFVQKSRKIQANPGTDIERARSLAVRAGEQAFWEFQDRTMGFVKGWDLVYADRPRVDLESLATTYPAQEGYFDDPLFGWPIGILKVGGIMMGLGVASVAVGGACFLIASAVPAAQILWIPGAVFGVTIGPALLILGLIVVIVGGVSVAGVAMYRSANKAKPEPAPARVPAPKPRRGVPEPPAPVEPIPPPLEAAPPPPPETPPPPVDSPPPPPLMPNDPSSP